MSTPLAIGAVAALAGLAALGSRRGSFAAVSPFEFAMSGGSFPRFVQVTATASWRWLPEYQDVALVQIELGDRYGLPPVPRRPVDSGYAEAQFDGLAPQGSPSQRFREGLTQGYIQAMMTGWGIWEIESVEARRGYGPLLYDLLLELAWWSGAKGVTPDRSGVSSDAERVWAYYAENRQDEVLSRPLPGDYPDSNKHTLRHRPFLDRVYAIKGVDGLRKISSHGRLKIYDPDHVLDLDYGELTT
jgi:hypothetical protein